MPYRSQDPKLFFREIEYPVGDYVAYLVTSSG